MISIEDWNVRDLFDSVADALFVLDRDWRIVYANRRTLEFFNVSRDAVEGLSYWDAFPLVRGSVFAAAVERAMSGNATEIVESRSLYRPDRWVELRAYSIGPGVAVYIADITERREAQGREQSMLQQLRIVANSLPALVAYLDADERHLFNNNAYAEWFGQAPDALKGRQAREVIGDAAYEELRPHIERALAGEHVEYEREALHSNGSNCHIAGSFIPDRSGSGDVRGFVAMVRDVTDRVLIERELRASEERYRTFIEQSSEGIWRFEFDEPIDTSLDTEAQVAAVYRQGYLAECNDAFARMYGFANAQEILNTRVIDFLIPEDPRNVAYLHAAVASNFRLTDAQSVEKDRYGNTKVYLNNVLGIVENGQLVRVWGTQRDVTDQQRADEERRQLLMAERAARSEAENANRVKDEFLSTLSHELRTPLNAILGWSQLLRSEESLAPDVRQGLDVIERNARSQTRIVEDLLDMSRIATGKVRLDIQQIDPGLIVRQALETIAPAAEAREIRIKPVLDTGPVTVMGDPSRLQQVVWNLLSNAVKFTQRGGHVVVRLERSNAHVNITVSDTGLGIRPQFLPHIFERFRQADATTTRSHGGLGIGLAIVKQLVELHGGSVAAASPGEGLGATFVVTLPIASTPDNTGETIATISCDPQVLTGMRILIVDDEPDARDLLHRIFEACDAVIATASSSDEALGLMESFRPDVLISDIGMPDEDGYALIRRVRSLGAESGGDVPAIALTAFARPEDLKRAITAGYHVHIAKPVEPNSLITTVASITGRLPAIESTGRIRMSTNDT